MAIDLQGTALHGRRGALSLVGAYFVAAAAIAMSFLALVLIRWETPGTA